MVSAEICQNIDDLAYISSVIKKLVQKIRIPDTEKQYIDITISHVKYSIYLEQNNIPEALKMAKIMEQCTIPMQRNKALYIIFNYEFAQVHFYAKNGANVLLIFIMS